MPEPGLHAASLRIHERAISACAWPPHDGPHAESRTWAGQPLKELKDAGYFVWWGGKNDLIPGQFSSTDHADVYFKATDDDYRRCGVDPHVLAPESTWRGEPDADTYYSFMRGGLTTLGKDEVRIDNDWGTVRGAIDFLESFEGD